MLYLGFVICILIVKDLVKILFILLISSFGSFCLLFVFGKLLFNLVYFFFKFMAAV